MELQYRKKTRIKLYDDITDKEYDFIVRYGLFESIHMVHPEEKDVKCIVLFKLKEINSGKQFIIYTDNKTTPDDELCVYSGFYHPYALFNRVCPIETDEDWSIVERFLKYINENEEGLF